MGSLSFSKEDKITELKVGCQARQCGYTICRAWSMREVGPCSTVHRIGITELKPVWPSVRDMLETGWPRIPARSCSKVQGLPNMAGPRNI
jgi:hypothetical protein